MSLLGIKPYMCDRYIEKIYDNPKKINKTKYVLIYDISLT